MELRRLRADLHIHTCLSPCGELAMSPRAVVDRAREVGLDLIAVTDHNTTENAAAVIRAAGAARTGPAVLAGIELTTVEEVHLLGLFDPGAELGPFQAAVFRNLPDVPSKKKFIKDQVIVDADDYVTGFSPRCLFGATRFSVHEAVDLIHGHGGLAVACHVDRESFSIVSQLGFIPPGLPLDAVEVSPRLTIAEARQAFGPFDPLPMVRFSDAHNPEEIGRATTDFLVASPDLGELRKALSGQDGRRIVPS
jgi:PHP family Zn ribbon phosphoesterase